MRKAPALPATTVGLVLALTGSNAIADGVVAIDASQLIPADRHKP